MTRHVTLNLLGTGFWTVGFVLAAKNIYPYCYIGIITGPILLSLGIISWVMYYKKDRGQFPNPFTSYRQARKNGSLFPGLSYLLNHIPEFWTSWFVLFIGITLTMTLVFKNSEEYKIAVKYIEADKVVFDKIGTIEYYGLLTSGTISTKGTASLEFSIIGERGTLNAKVQVDNGQVETIDYK